jgi:2'-5' RNA ligase
MKAAIALLVDYRVHNRIRKLALELYRKYGVGLPGYIPYHITLKQPFEIVDLPSFEAYFDQFAASVEPFPIMLRQLELIVSLDEQGEQGLIWVSVAESAALRALHNRVIQELAERFENTAVRYEGAEYRFHVTVATGGQPPEVYRRASEEYRGLAVDLTYTAREMALFCSETGALGTFFVYKILPLGS